MISIVVSLIAWKTTSWLRLDLYRHCGGEHRFFRGCRGFNTIILVFLYCPVYWSLWYFKEFGTVVQQNSKVDQKSECLVEKFWTQIVATSSGQEHESTNGKVNSSIGSWHRAFLFTLFLNVLTNVINAGNDSCVIGMNAKSLSRWADANNRLLSNHSDSESQASV